MMSVQTTNQNVTPQRYVSVRIHTSWRMATVVSWLPITAHLKNFPHLAKYMSDAQLTKSILIIMQKIIMDLYSLSSVKCIISAEDREMPKCIHVYYMYSIFLPPVPKVPLDQRCERGDMCADENALCTSGTCQCREGYNKDGNICSEYRSIWWIGASLLSLSVLTPMGCIGTIG